MPLTETEKYLMCNEIISRINKKYRVYTINDTHFELIKLPYAIDRIEQGSMVLYNNKVYMLVGDNWKSLCLCDL